MFLRIVPIDKKQECLVDFDKVHLINVDHVAGGRVYFFFVGGENFKLVAKPGNPVTEMLDKLYDEALKS